MTLKRSRFQTPTAQLPLPDGQKKAGLDTSCGWKEYQNVAQEGETEGPWTTSRTARRVDGTNSNTESRAGTTSVLFGMPVCIRMSVHKFDASMQAGTLAFAVLQATANAQVSSPMPQAKAILAIRVPGAMREQIARDAEEVLPPGQGIWQWCCPASARTGT